MQIVQRENNYLKQSFRYNLQSRSFNELPKLIIHADQIPQEEHRGQYNALTINDLAVLLINEDIVLHNQSGHLRRVSALNRSFDTLQYPLMYIRGDDGYHNSIKKNN
uniref:Uncharacterized protein n=1 Tax=Sipha flava TaxID=143950 RepID=A0A2S2QHL7_9HEMI